MEPQNVLGDIAHESWDSLEEEKTLSTRLCYGPRSSLWSKQGHTVMGSTVTNILKQEELNEAQQRMFSTQQLRKLNVSLSILVQFYRSTTESTLTSIMVWFSSASCCSKHLSTLQGRWLAASFALHRGTTWRQGEEEGRKESQQPRPLRQPPVSKTWETETVTLPPFSGLPY